MAQGDVKRPSDRRRPVALQPLAPQPPAVWLAWGPANPRAAP
jgi:hypothetical protein